MCFCTHDPNQLVRFIITFVAAIPFCIPGCIAPMIWTDVQVRIAHTSHEMTTPGSTKTPTTHVQYKVPYYFQPIGDSEPPAGTICLEIAQHTTPIQELMCGVQTAS